MQFRFPFFKLLSFYIKQHVIPAETNATKRTQPHQTYIYTAPFLTKHTNDHKSDLKRDMSRWAHGGLKAVECLSSHTSHHHRWPEGPRAAKTTEWRASLSLQTADLWIIHINTAVTEKLYIRTKQTRPSERIKHHSHDQKFIHAPQTLYDCVRMFGIFCLPNVIKIRNLVVMFSQTLEVQQTPYIYMVEMWYTVYSEGIILFAH